jgi:cytochrome c oxidase subunit IV
MNLKSESHFTGPYITLLLLLAITVSAAFFHLGMINMVIALLIAVVQMTVITLYFMQLRLSSHLNWIVALGSLLWLGILFTLVMGDYATRNWMG